MQRFCPTTDLFQQLSRHDHKTINNLALSYLQCCICRHICFMTRYWFVTPISIILAFTCLGSNIFRTVNLSHDTHSQFEIAWLKSYKRPRFLVVHVRKILISSVLYVYLHLSVFFSLSPIHKSTLSLISLRVCIRYFLQ